MHALKVRVIFKAISGKHKFNGTKRTQNDPSRLFVASNPPDITWDVFGVQIKGE